MILVVVVLSLDWVSSEVAIYSMKADCWRYQHFAYGYCSPQGAGVFVHSALHWIMDTNELLTFNVKSEDFSLMPLPNMQEKDDVNVIKLLGLLRERLCVSCTYQNGGEAPAGESFCMWVMNEYGVKESWTKLVSLQDVSIMCHGKLNALGDSKTGGKILLQQNSKDLSYFDPNKKKLDIIELPRNLRNLQNAIFYVSSLVSPIPTIKGPRFTKFKHMDMKWEVEVGTGVTTYYQRPKRPRLFQL